MLAGELGVIAKLGEEIGLPVKRRAEHPTGPEHATRAFRRDRHLAERVCERGRARGSFGEPAKLQEPETGIGCVGQPSEHHRKELLHHSRVPGETGTELVERRARARDV